MCRPSDSVRVCLHQLHIYKQMLGSRSLVSGIVGVYLAVVLNEGAGLFASLHLANSGWPLLVFAAVHAAKVWVSVLVVPWLVCYNSRACSIGSVLRCGMVLCRRSL